MYGLLCMTSNISTSQKERAKVFMDSLESSRGDGSKDGPEDQDDDLEVSHGDVIETIGQAYEWLRARAMPKGAAFLTEGGMKTNDVQHEEGSLSGVRRAIYTLLPAPQRRRFFFEMASSKEGLLRLRECFGAPPYAFLNPGDIYALNAGAIGLRRTHLSYEYGSPIPPFGQVGNVMQDDAGNEYSIVPDLKKTGEGDPLPLVNAISQGTMAHLVLQISLRQHERIPNPRHDLVLRESTYYSRVRGRPPRSTLRVKILSTHTSASRRRTAILNTRLLSVDTDDTSDTIDTNENKQKRKETRSTEEPRKDASKKARLPDDPPPMPEFVEVNS